LINTISTGKSSIFDPLRRTVFPDISLEKLNIPSFSSISSSTSTFFTPISAFNYKSALTSFLHPPNPPNIPPSSFNGIGGAGGNNNNNKNSPVLLLIGNIFKKKKRFGDNETEIIVFNDTERLDNEERKEYTSFLDWWEAKTAKSHGLLIYFMPAIVSQVKLLSNMGLFLLDRMGQYLQPTMLAATFALFTPVGMETIRKAMIASILISGVFMFIDTYRAGAYWTPLQSPSNDSYAVVTG
jgi:hypothetical protein